MQSTSAQLCPGAAAPLMEMGWLNPGAAHVGVLVGGGVAPPGESGGAHVGV